VKDATIVRQVEHRVLPAAPASTTGQLRAAVLRSVIEADPDAAERRRQAAEARRRVELLPTDSFTADLRGRDLPISDAIAADSRISALARALKAAGDPRQVEFLRAEVYLKLLLGTLPEPVCAYGVKCTAGVPDAGENAAERPASNADGVAAAVQLIVPVDTLEGRSDRPGEVPGYGPVPAEVARALAAQETEQRCYVGTDAAGRAVRHEHAPRRDVSPNQNGASAGPHAMGTGMAEQERPRKPLPEKPRNGIVPSREPGQSPPPEGTKPADNGFSHPEPRVTAYRPGATLRRAIQVRDQTCRFPSCRQPAQACDIDHTIAYEEGGETCDCNLAPLCRKHHQLKQLPGWTLEQPEPGHLIWTTPSGRRYEVWPDPYHT
jgi:hypothetical protein